MAYSSKFIIASMLLFACNSGNVTIDKNAPIYKEMSFSEFYWIQTSPNKMAELEGKIIELKGYPSSQSAYENKGGNFDLGKYKINFGPGLNASGFSVECYFNEKIQVNSLKENRIKGQVVERGMLKLKNCVVVE